MSTPARIANTFIRLYQERLSPRKGWTCAHLVAHGGRSCSAAVSNIIARRGVVRGLVPTVARFAACYQAAQLLQTQQVQGVCCCGGIPVPFRFGGRR